MTELKTLIEENASLIRQLKYNVKEKQKAIEMLLEQLSREGEKVFELVEVLKEAFDEYAHPIYIGDPDTLSNLWTKVKQALAKVEGKE